MSKKIDKEKELNQEPIKPEDRVPFWQKVSFGFGVVSDHYANVSIAYIFFLPFFNDYLKVPATIVTMALALARLWDAITDPVMGMISDRCKLKFGRRKPFIIVGSILTGLFFPVIWLASPNWSQGAIIAYLVAALLIYYTFYSIFSVPYESLGTELTADYRERTNTVVVRSYVQQIFNMGLNWAFPLATWLALQSWVGGDVNGVRLVSIAVAVVIIFAGVLPGLFCQERYRKIAQAENTEKTSFKEGLKALIKNTQLMILIGIICTYLLAIMSAGVLGYYINVYYIFDGDRFAGAVLGGIDGTLRTFFAFFAAYIIKRLSNKYDKHHLMITCVISMLIAVIGLFFTMIPDRPLMSLLMKPLQSLGEVGFWILILAMRADVCDWDEYQTGHRREGIISATTNWFTKSTMTLAAMLSGLMIQYAVGLNNKVEDDVKAKIAIEAQAKFDAMSEAERAPVKAEDNVFVRMFKATPDDGSGRSWERRVTDAMFKNGDKPEVTVALLETRMEQEQIIKQQKPGTMLRLRLVYVIPKAIALILALYFMSRYKLSHARMTEIRKELEARRGKAEA